MPKSIIKHCIGEAKRVDGVDENVTYDSLPSTDTRLVLSEFKRILDANLDVSQKTSALYDLLHENYIPKRAPKTGIEKKKLHVIQYAYYETRPMLEGLFYEHTSIFQEMVKSLLNANEPAFNNLFFSGLSVTDLKKEDLYAWNNTINYKVCRALLDSKQYALLLCEKNIKRGEVAYKCASATLRYIEDNSAKVPTDDSDTSKLTRLYFKLTILKNLHSKDGEFATQREYKKMFANVMSALFAFVPNVLNFVVTGNWFFGNKTETQEKIDHAHKATGIKAPLRF